MLVYETSMQNNLMSTLAAGGITPSNKKRYTIGQVGFLLTEIARSFPSQVHLPFVHAS